MSVSIKIILGEKEEKLGSVILRMHIEGQYQEEEKEKKKGKKKKDKKKGNEEDDNKEEPKEEVIQEEKSDKAEEVVKQHDSKLGVDYYENDNGNENKFTWREQPIKPGYARSVMLYRAILGSVERLFAILRKMAILVEF